MGAEVILVPAVLAIPALAILTPTWLRSQERRRILEALSAAAEKGTTLPHEHVAALLDGVQGVRPARAPRPRPPDHVRDMRRGTLLLALTAGVVLIGVAVSAIATASGADFGPQVFLAIASAGAIPGMIGAAYLLLSRMGRRAPHADATD
jgi:hypothetical protein